MGQVLEAASVLESCEGCNRPKADLKQVIAMPQCGPLLLPFAASARSGVGGTHNVRTKRTKDRAKLRRVG